MSSFTPQISKSRQRLFDALDADPPRLDLVALAIASIEFPELDPDPSTRLLDSYAARVAAIASQGVPSLQALRHVLGKEEAFRGDSEDYHSPHNSFLHIVLERRRGLPITLSIVYLEVARRAGIHLFGVSLPGHFVVATEMEGRKVVMDPFNGGQFLNRAACESLLGRAAPNLRFSSKMITAAQPRSIAYRMLTNLKGAYLQRGDGERALRVVEHLLALAPDHPSELRARASIFSALGAYRAALADVERCLELAPEAPDHDHLLVAARELRQRVRYLN
jgi:regulator of sirC expression with transglutaminase-like and TPR domain